MSKVRKRAIDIHARKTKRRRRTLCRVMKERVGVVAGSVPTP